MAQISPWFNPLSKSYSNGTPSLDLYRHRVRPAAISANTDIHDFRSSQSRWNYHLQLIQTGELVLRAEVRGRLRPFPGIAHF